MFTSKTISSILSLSLTHRHALFSIIALFSTPKSPYRTRLLNRLDCRFIRSWVARRYSTAAADNMVIQYGGSVSPETVDELMGMPDIDGALVPPPLSLYVELFWAKLCQLCFVSFRCCSRSVVRLLLLQSLHAFWTSSRHRNWWCFDTLWSVNSKGFRLPLAASTLNPFAVAILATCFLCLLLL